MTDWLPQRMHAGPVTIETHPREGVRAQCADCGWRTADPFDLYAVRGDALLHALDECPGKPAATQAEML